MAEPNKQIYHAHRLRQRRRLLDAAQRLFDEHGIDRVTMAEIIATSGVRASTLYQYFQNKDEIVWVLVAEIMSASTEAGRQLMERPGVTALGKITSLLELMAEDLAHRTAQVRFMAQFDAMYARQWSAEHLLSLEARIFPEGFAGLIGLLREGIADGSLRPDLNPELTLHSVMNAVVGAQRRLASLGSRVETEYGQPVDRLFRETVRIVLLGLQAQ